MTEIRIVAEETFGETCLGALVEAVSGWERPVVGLPTGRTPIALYGRLRAAVEAGRLDVSGWRPVAIDEYGGPRNHPCSNRSFLAGHWAAIPGAPPVEQFDPEADDITTECRRMASVVEQAGGLTVALLGIGTNGHLAFNEPGSAPDCTVRRVELHEASRESAHGCWGAEAPAWGVTLGLKELLAAERVVVMANGAAKARIVARAIEGPETVQTPASLVRRAPHATWVLDSAAASELRGSSGPSAGER